MRLADWNMDQVVRAQAGTILVLTIALFFYESSRPQFRSSEEQLQGRKHSPMETEQVREVVRRLPQLPERYQRKVLVYQVRYRRPAPQHQFARQWPSRVATGKSLLALNRQEAPTESGGRE